MSGGEGENIEEKKDVRKKKRTQNWKDESATKGTNVGLLFWKKEREGEKTKFSLIGERESSQGQTKRAPVGGDSAVGWKKV